MLVGFVWKHTRDVALAATQREMVEQSDAVLAIWRADGEAALIEAVDAHPPGDPSLVVAILDTGGRRLVGYAPDRTTVPIARPRSASPISPPTTRGPSTTPATS